jgi:hypothetical protein
MVKSVLHDELRFNLPANYCICVKGFLDDSWSDRLSGFRISNQVSDRESPVVALTGLIFLLMSFWPTMLFIKKSSKKCCSWRPVLRRADFPASEGPFHRRIS